jgi:hypothetical protein
VTAVTAGLLALGVPALASTSGAPSRSAAAAARAALVARQQQIDAQRGIGTFVPGNPRVTAIRQMQRQQAALNGPGTPTWSPLGPAPIPNGQLDGTIAPVSGRVTSIAVDPINSAIFFVGTASGGLWRTEDGGADWVPLMDGAESLAVGSVAIAPSQPSTVYVGTGEANQSGDSHDGVGLYRIDNADTVPVVTGPIDPVTTFDIQGTTVSLHAFGNMSIGAIAVDPNNPAIVYVGTAFGFTGTSGSYPLNGQIPPLPQAGLFRTTNGTAAAGSVTFTHLTVRPEDNSSSFTVGSIVSGMALDPSNDNNLVLGVTDYTNNNTDIGVWRTTNAQAATPSFLETLSTGLQEDLFALSMVKTGSKVTAVEEDGGLTNGTVRKSIDGGKTWSALNLTPFSSVCGQQCWYDVAAAVDAKNPNIIIVGGTANGGFPNMIRSVDGGATWAQDDAGLHTDVHAITFAPSNAKIAITGNDGGVWGSKNGGQTWSNLNTGGLSATQFESVSHHPTDPNFLIGGTQDNGTNRRDSTGAWLQVAGGDGGHVVIDSTSTAPSTTTMYHTFSGPFVQASTDGGQTWHDIFTDASSDRALFYPPLGRGPGSPNSIYFGTDRLFRSPDRGASDAVVSQSFNPHVITTIGIAPQSDNIRLVGREDGSVFLTTTGSTTLTDVTGPWAANEYVASAVIDPNNSNIAYITLDGFTGGASHVWKTTGLSASGTTWSAAGSGIPDIPVNDLEVDPANSKKLYAGTDIGVYFSTDGGTTWAPLGTGLPVVPVFDLAIGQPGTTHELLDAGTHGRGIWQLHLGPATGTVITTPTTLTGATTATFSKPVKNVTAKNFVIVNDRTGVPMGGTVTCLNASSATVSCAKGPVTTATFNLTGGTQFVSGDDYTALINPVFAPTPIRNKADGQSIPYFSSTFTA